MDFLNYISIILKCESFFNKIYNFIFIDGKIRYGYLNVHSNEINVYMSFQIRRCPSRPLKAPHDSTLLDDLTSTALLALPCPAQIKPIGARDSIYVYSSLFHSLLHYVN